MIDAAGADDPQGGAPGPQSGTVARALGFAAIGMTTAALMPRLTPIGNGDFFTFVSVAERLRAGDRLYADVWDNKDPFFYYALSIASSMGPWGYFVLELAWVTVALASVASLGLSQGLPRWWSMVVAFGLAPWCLIGYVYTGTLSMMPGVALALATVALAARRRWFAVGMTLGLLLFLKVILVPVAIAGALVFWRARRARALLATAVGGAVMTAGGLGVLLLRGELPAYVSMLLRNSDYAERMVDGGGLTGFAQHLGRAFPGIDHPGERIAAGAVFLMVLVAVTMSHRGRGTRSVALCAAVTGLVCVLVLGLTAVWSHHVQMLAIPGCLALVAVASAGPPRGVARTAVLLPVGVLAAFVLGGATPPSSLFIKPMTASQPLDQARGDSPEALSTVGDDVSTYSRLGRNDVYAHARGLGDLTLACRDFQQYPFDPPTTFSRTLGCLPESDVVFVANNFADLDESAEYASFATDVEALLAEEFACTATEYGRKCLRTEGGTG